MHHILRPIFFLKISLLFLSPYIYAANSLSENDSNYLDVLIKECLNEAPSHGRMNILKEKVGWSVINKSAFKEKKKSQIILKHGTHSFILGYKAAIIDNEKITSCALAANLDSPRDVLYEFSNIVNFSDVAIATEVNGLNEIIGKITIDKKNTHFDFFISQHITNEATVEGPVNASITLVQSKSTTNKIHAFKDSIIPLHFGLKGRNQSQANPSTKTMNHDNAQPSPLILGILNNNIEAVKAALSKGDDVNQENNELTPLGAAIGLKRTEMVSLLINHGANVHFKSQDGTTMVFHAAHTGNIEIVKLLINAGASKNDRAKPAILAAAVMGKWDIVEYLLSCGVDINMTFDNGSDLLYFAIIENNTKMAVNLINKGSNINSRYHEGGTPLMIAANNGHLEIVKTLIKNKAKLNLTSKNGYTALMWSVSNNQLPVIKYLLNSNALPNLKGEHGWTALTMAIYNKNIEAVKLLIRKGADVNQTGTQNLAPLMIAVNNSGNLQIIKLLCEAGAHTSSKNENGETATVCFR